MADIPPKQQLSGADGVGVGESHGLPQYHDPQEASHSGAKVSSFEGERALAIQGSERSQDAYQILKAFQDCIERERESSQRKLAALGIAFCLVLAIAVAGFFFMWFSTVRSLHSSQSELLAAALSSRAEAPKPAQEAAALPSSADISRQIGDAVKRAVEEERKRHEAEEEAESGREKLIGEALEKVSATLDAVRKENELLRSALEKSKAMRQEKPQAAQKPPQKAAFSGGNSQAAKPAAPSAKPAAPNAAIAKPQGAAPQKAAGSKPAQAPKAVQEENGLKVTQVPKVDVVEGERGNAVFRTEAPEIKIKRPVLKGYESDSVRIGSDSGIEAKWQYYLPTETK